MGAKYSRVLVKLSGEALRGESGGEDTTLSAGVLTDIAAEIKEIHALSVQLALVIGGGNIIRGLNASQAGIDRATGDYMGMLATVINCMALQDALEKGRVVLLAGGTGNPHFTTDTAAALRAMELKAQALMKATRVDGVYDNDPLKDPNARRFKRLTYTDVLKRDLKVMDATAVSLCMDNRLPILVFKLAERGNMLKVILGEDLATVVGELPDKK